MGLSIDLRHAVDLLIEAHWDAAIAGGLTAAAYVYANLVKRALAGGYTSGDFVTGRVLNSVTIGEPSGLYIDVGTDLDYAEYWEIGHHNIFTRRYERVMIWEPALDAAGPEMSDVFSGTMASIILQGPVGTDSTTLQGGAE
jgi:hypothetical protein